MKDDNRHSESCSTATRAEFEEMLREEIKDMRLLRRGLRRRLRLIVSRKVEAGLSDDGAEPERAELAA